MLSFFLVAEALTGLIYHRPSGENSNFQFKFIEFIKFIEDNHKYFYPPEDPDDCRFDVGNEHELVEDVDP